MKVSLADHLIDVRFRDLRFNSFFDRWKTNGNTPELCVITDEKTIAPERIWKNQDDFYPESSAILRQIAEWLPLHGSFVLHSAAFDADCLTVNPYLGTDGIAPFVKECAENGKGIFILVKTSNKSSGELQDLKSGGKFIYEHMADLVKEWGSELVGTHGYSSAGAVVGATYPEQAAQLRAQMPRTYFLVPGYGAQGGGAKDVAPAFNKDGLGAIVNASRSIMCAYKKNGGSVGEAAREEAIRMRDDILSVLK